MFTLPTLRGLKNSMFRIIILLIFVLLGCHKEEKIKIGDDEQAIWSPDVRYIAFNRFFHVMIDPPWIVDSVSGVRIFDLDKNKVVDSVFYSFCVDWFPNGDEILLWRSEGYKLYNLSNHTIRSVFNNGLPCTAMDISPNGEKILGVNPSDSPDSSMIVMVDTSGLNSKILFNSGLAPSWHPSGDRLVFIRTFDNKRQICIGDTNGNIIRVIEPKDGDLIAFGGRGPRFSPDGSMICYSLYHYKDGGPDDFIIHICDSLGENDIELIDGFHPFWSPLGDKIVFSRYSVDEDAVSLWIMNSNGNGLKRITY